MGPRDNSPSTRCLGSIVEATTNHFPTSHTMRSWSSCPYYPCSPPIQSAKDGGWLWENASHRQKNWLCYRTCLEVFILFYQVGSGLLELGKILGLLQLGKISINHWMVVNSALWHNLVLFLSIPSLGHLILDILFILYPLILNF